LAELTAQDLHHALTGIANLDQIGSAVTTSVRTDPVKALGPLSQAYASLGSADQTRSTSSAN
jgi:hypothetical protein